MRQQNRMPLFSPLGYVISPQKAMPFVQLENSFPALAEHMVKGMGIAAPRKETLLSPTK